MEMVIGKRKQSMESSITSYEAKLKWHPKDYEGIRCADAEVVIRKEFAAQIGYDISDYFTLSFDPERNEYFVKKSTKDEGLKLSHGNDSQYRLRFRKINADYSPLKNIHFLDKKQFRIDFHSLKKDENNQSVIVFKLSK